MSSVEFVSNPEPSVSTHSWKVQGVSQLTRENKVSSLPFWVPNDKMKTHQFHLVLLKGLTPAARPDDDAYGLVIELVPPPMDPTRDTAAASTFPGGCYVTARVVNHAEPTSGDIVDSQTALIDDANGQIGFPELLPASAARSPDFLSGEPPAITIVLTIRTGVNVFAQQITTSVSSLWSTLTSSVSKLLDTGARVYHEGRKEFEEAVKAPQESARSTEATTTAAAAVANPPPPWDVVPAKWTGRAEEWHDLVFDKAVHDEGLFLYGPDRPITEDERQLLLQNAFNYRLLVELYTQFNFDRDVHEGLLASPALREQRYHLVPARIKDGLFWANYFWKVACLATCESETQVRVLLTVLNAPPAAKPKKADPAASGLSEAEVMTCATDAQEAADLLLEYLNEEDNDDDVFLMETAAHTCEDHVKRLEPLFRRTDLTESTSVVVGTTLRRLRERIARYHETVKRREAAKAAAAQPPVPPSASQTPPDDKPQTPVQSPLPPTAMEVFSLAPQDASPEPAAPPLPNTASSPATDPNTATGASATVSAGGTRAVSGSGPMVAFPKMPWEEDEEDGL